MFLSLIIVPVLYVVFDKLVKRHKNPDIQNELAEKHVVAQMEN